MSDRRSKAARELARLLRANALARIQAAPQGVERWVVLAGVAPVLLGGPR